MLWCCKVIFLVPVSQNGFIDFCDSQPMMLFMTCFSLSKVPPLANCAMYCIFETRFYMLAVVLCRVSKCLNCTLQIVKIRQKYWAQFLCTLTHSEQYKAFTSLWRWILVCLTFAERCWGNCWAEALLSATLFLKRIINLRREGLPKSNDHANMGLTYLPLVTYSKTTE